MLLDRHRAKIVTLAQLCDALPLSDGLRSEVVLCNGVFDIVHPGHLRHLLYARQHGSILVASVTSDRYVNKGAYRPHVPQGLRAANLALYDIIDYVVISDAPDPSELIRTLRPGHYAKGFEYARANRAGAPIAEEAVVAEIGGEVVYTPGDIVYSSSALIDAEPPDLRREKLALVMQQAELSFSDLRAAVGGCAGATVLIVGDLIVDVIQRCSMISSGHAKTPTISVRRDQQERFVGGAGVVALHAAAAGARVEFLTIVGADPAAAWAVTQLEAAGITVTPLSDDRPTTIKEAIVVDGQRLLKVDTVDNSPISDRLLAEACAEIRETRAGVVIFSDFRHGIFNARTIPALTAAIPAHAVRVADSQVASRWGNVTEFKEFDLITPNEREARFATGDQDLGVAPLASKVRQQALANHVILKMGARGALCCYVPALVDERVVTVGSFAARVVDPVGAGDALLAYAALTLARTHVGPVAAAVVATIVGTVAASIECEYDGNVPVAPDAVLARLKQLESGVP